VKTLLVVMPFAAMERPALGVSTLKAQLLREGLPCDVAYLDLEFAECVGRGAYDLIAKELPVRALVGEWVFAGSLWEEERLPAGYVEDILESRWRVTPEDIETVRRVRRAVPEFLRRCLRSVPWADYGLVGFSSFVAMNVASLSLARLVKRIHPELPIVFGGANWHGSPGVAAHRRFTFVDFAVSGDAEEALPALVRALRARRPGELSSIPGLVYRSGTRTVVNPESPPDLDLDHLPVPDFSDFYAARHRLPHVRAALPSLTFESARGCWWADRRACAFCGIDARYRTYRTKSAARAVAELRELTRRWPCTFVHVADPLVSTTFLDEVLPALVAEPLRAPLFFEVRPGLSRSQLTAVAAAQAEIQPGIESFNDHVLRLMQKGTRGIENIRLLKWCRELGVQAHWNLLHGLPGETEEDYEELLALLPAIRFLQPPHLVQTICVDRRSPYHREPGRHGIAALEPLRPYRYLYPFGGEDLEQIAYAFDHRCRAACTPPDVGAALEREVQKWTCEWRSGDLRMAKREGGRLTLKDTRPGALCGDVELSELETTVYDACRDIASGVAVIAAVRSLHGPDEDVEASVSACLDSLVTRRLMVRVGERYLSLALPPARASRRRLVTSVLSGPPA
jgi:ribosomal peptide maturation radical SAM protein 1